MSKQEGQNFALSKGALFKEVSAKRNEGVQEVFDQLVDEVGNSLFFLFQQHVIRNRSTWADYYPDPLTNEDRSTT